MLYAKAEFTKNTNIKNLKDKTMSNDSSKTSDTVEKGFFRASAADFKKIPGSPIAYWVSSGVLQIYKEGQLIGDLASPCNGMNTTNNDKFVRNWNEVNLGRIGFNYSTADEAFISKKKWFPYNKGGGLRKWYGNNYFLVNYENNGKTICDYIDYESGSKVNSTGRVINRDKYFKKSITWSSVTSSIFSSRCCEVGFVFDNGGSSIFSNDLYYDYIAAFLGTKLAFEILKVLNPTLNFQPGNLSSLPICISKLEIFENKINEVTRLLISLAKKDWDSYETSWDFTDLPLLNSQTVGRVSDSVTRQLDDVGLRDKATNPTYPLPLSIKETYAQLRAHWQEVTLETQRLEEENNRIFIDAYGLQDELTPDVSLKEITLTCNPYYRYGKEPRIDTKEHEKNPTDISVNSCSLVVQKSFPKDTELEERLLADTLKEFISYAVGCMFGRYSLDKPGLILANQGETIADYLKQIPEPIFSTDDDNVIPMLDGDWFTDDVTERFGQFLKVTFGDAHYEENLKFIEQALGKDIRKYFLKDFYTDHLKRYKKRPIYWLFSSPKGTFNALIYMHRYRPDTVSVVLNDYLREFRTKLSAHKNHLEAVSISSNASAGDKTKALKDIENHRKMIDELDVYEREVLYPLATEQIEIDLDDGVKVNYQKFGEALKKIPGLAAKEG
jgi:type II restriction/modification system DNA methylase subunit YeeA